MRRFGDLNPREVLSLAIAVEEANSARFATLAELYSSSDEKLHALFTRLRDEERNHARMLAREWERRFGGGPRPVIKESDVEEAVEAVEVAHGEHGVFDDLTREAALDLVRRSEEAAHRFYTAAAAACDEPDLKAIYLDLAAMEARHASALAPDGDRPEGTGRGGMRIDGPDRR